VVVRPLALVVQQVACPDHMVVVESSPDPEADSHGFVEGVAVVEEDGHQRGCFDRRKSLRPHARQAHYGLSL
jgi:hypothetical protein